MAIWTREQVFTIPGNQLDNTKGPTNLMDNSTVTPATNPTGGRPSITNSSTVDNAAGGYANSGVDSYGAEHKKADDYAKGLYDEQLKTDPITLNQNQYANYAEDGGQYGRANNRSYNTTLQLSREADAYNNNPTEQVRDWKPGGSTNIGSVSYVDPYNRPKIETEEMREMQKSRQLDLNQKQLAQSLQAAVNRKDLDAFIQLFQQRYNMNLTRYQADLAMRTFQYQRLAEQVLFKDRTIFSICAELWGLGEKARTIWDIAQRDPGLATVYMTILAGRPIVLEEDVARAQTFKDYLNKGYSHGEAWVATERYMKEHMVDPQLNDYSDYYKEGKKGFNK